MHGQSLNTHRGKHRSEGAQLLSPTKERGLDENGENDKFAFQPEKRGLSCSHPVSMTKMASKCHAGKGMVYQRHGFLFSEILEAD